MITPGYYTSQLENLLRKFTSPQKSARCKQNQIRRNWMLSNCDRITPLQPQEYVQRNGLKPVLY